MDRLRAFEVFATVVGQGSFTRAADKLETSPANVTRYVNELEESLGARLLNRTSRRLSLTETGKTLYDKALSILEDVAEAEAIASSAALQPRGRLRVNAPLSFRHSSSGAALAALLCALSGYRAGYQPGRSGRRSRRGGLRSGRAHLARRVA